MRQTNKTKSKHWGKKMIDSLSFGIFISISCLFSSPLNSLKDSTFSAALMGEDMDKERHAVSDACCRERPLSSSHFRVFWAAVKWLSVLSLCSCWGVRWTSSGPWRHGSSLPCYLLPLLLWEVPNSPPVPPVNTVHCVCARGLSLHTFLSTGNTNLGHTHRNSSYFWSSAVLTSGVLHAGSEIWISIDGVRLRLHATRLALSRSKWVHAQAVTLAYTHSETCTQIHIPT